MGEESAQDRDFKGVWIPKDIWLTNKLKPMEKFFLLEIDSLDNEEGCFASNAHFSKLFNVSKGRCTQIIKKLEDEKWVTINLHWKGKLITKRVIKVVNKLTTQELTPEDTVVNKLNRVVNKLNRGSEKIKQGYLINAEGNNTKSNNTKSNKEANSSEEIFEYWKQVLNHPRSIFDDKRASVIKKALKMGFTVDDLKAAISGCSKTDHNIGNNEQNKIYDGLHIIFRDANQIERFMGNNSVTQSAQQREMI